jgi:cholesterol oxidase
MAVDDHEFRDDYSDMTRSKRSREWQAASDTFWRYQYAAGPLGEKFREPGVPGCFWYEFTHAGVHTFVADTRTERVDSARIDRQGAAIMSDTQFAAISRWLASTKTGMRPRFLVLPTPVAPVFKAAVSRDEYQVRCDDWQRFPASRQRLFELFLEHGTERLVLLSGDYHCFADVVIEVGGPGSTRSVKVRSVVTSGTYCPYHFANTDPDELWHPDPALPDLLWKSNSRWTYGFRGKVRTGSGYTRLTTCGEDVDVQFVVPGASDGDAPARPARQAPCVAPAPAPDVTPVDDAATLASG